MCDDGEISRHFALWAQSICISPIKNHTRQSPVVILMANGMTKKPWWLDREGLVNLALLLGLV